MNIETKTIMKKPPKLTMGILIGILVCLIIYWYFNIPGSKIAGVSNITTSSNVVIRKRLS